MIIPAHSPAYALARAFLLLAQHSTDKAFALTPFRSTLSVRSLDRINLERRKSLLVVCQARLRPTRSGRISAVSVMLSTVRS